MKDKATASKLSQEFNDLNLSTPGGDKLTTVGKIKYNQYYLEFNYTGLSTNNINDMIPFVNKYKGMIVIDNNHLSLRLNCK